MEKFQKGAWCEVDDYITNYLLKKKKKRCICILLYDDQIIMKVESPKDLDPTFNLSINSE